MIGVGSSLRSALMPDAPVEPCWNSHDPPGSTLFARACMWPQSTIGAAPSSAAAPTGSCMSAMSISSSVVRTSSAARRAAARTSSSSSDGRGLVRREPRVADAEEREPRDLGHVTVEHHGVWLGGDRPLGDRRVVVAADEDVRGVDRGDLVDVAVLDRRALVHDVAGVDDDIDLELVDH